ncbi:MAG: LysR family transcriptional regulator [Pseudobdellovibrio sp.]
MDYNQISLFIEVVEAGSISEAARRLNVAKSNISRALAGLEKSLKIQLIYRNTRSFKPTEVGQDLYNLCKGPFSQIRESVEKVKKDEVELKGKLIITVAVDFAHTVLPFIISDFNKHYPKIELDIRGEDRRVDLVKEGVDLALRVGQLNDSMLKSLKICDISSILVASPQYLAQQPKIRSLDQLQDHRMISFIKKYENQLQLIKKNGKKQKVKISTGTLVNNPLISKSLAVMGQGIAILPDIICYEELKSGELIRVLPEFSSEPSPLHYVWPAQTAESPRVRAFINFSKDILRNYLSKKSVF